MATTEQRFIQRLVAADPVLQPLLDEHLDDMEGDLSPHLVMPTIGTWVEQRGPDNPEAQHVVVDVDRELGDALAAGDEDVENVIAVSFLEFWPTSPQPGGEWRGRFPERLAALLQDMDHDKPGR